MTKQELLTREDITNHADISGFLHVSRIVPDTIEGRACFPERLPFLALMADLMRTAFPKRFCYLEIGTLFGASMCAIGFHQCKAEIEKSAGIDLFTYYGSPSDPSSGVEVSIETADRNIRYFGLRKPFALFKGDSQDEAIAKRALAYLRDTVHMLYIDGDHDTVGVMQDFARYSQHVEPGGLVVFDDYHDNDWPGVTEAVDAIDKTGWNVIGPLAPASSVPTMFVMQKDLSA